MPSKLVSPSRVLFFFGVLCLSLVSAPLRGDDPAPEKLTQFGFAHRDITPTEPMRLSGYSNRETPASQVDEKLQVRSMAFKSPQGNLHAIVMVDLLGLGAAQNATIAKRVAAEHKIPRERLAVSCTHTHTGPQFATAASNLLSVPFSEEERKRAEAYSDRVIDQIVAVIGDAIRDLQPGKLYLGEGKLGFSVNRRVLKNGKWTGFGINPAGPVDHSLPVLKITDSQGKIRGIVFNYACHATTLGPQDNRISPDWPGYAARFLEEAHPGVTALTLIGCGADTNPEPRTNAMLKDASPLAIAHGREATEAVRKVLAQPMKEIAAAPVCSFGYAALPFDRPTVAELTLKLADKQPVVRKHAQNMLDILKKKGRLPETYPLPIETWQFGNDLTMVFMGGEVVLDYVLRMKQELQSGYVWATAYTNDVPGYIASERVRGEGGYEVDFSMIYYNQPGRWSTGTEDLIFKRIKEILEHPQAEQPKDAANALQQFRIMRGFSVELVAAEPLVRDPINFAFGADGRLWVVEMGDYPQGAEGKPLGKIIVLEDTNRDGRFDERKVFLDGIEFPTGVFPWRDGVVVSAPPEIFFARDSNGDGVADERKLLFSGFGKFNPQHRMNGFAYGLDHWLYVAGGDPNFKIRAELLGKDVSLPGNDFRINPDTGQIEPETGRTQYGRSRDDFGNWFGNDNSHPWFHYVVPERFVRRNPHVVFPRNVVNAFGDGDSPPVFPSSRVTERFNDLRSANRFTSACSPAILRDHEFSQSIFTEETLGDDVNEFGVVCEPVHNLIQLIRLRPLGVTYHAERIGEYNNSKQEFLSTTDTWFRPVRAMMGPDGALWIADMYRQVIEHPEWIPEDWQAKLDLRAGSDRGRIYRVYKSKTKMNPLPRLNEKSQQDVAALLVSSNGTLRDMAQQWLLERPQQSRKLIPDLTNRFRHSRDPSVQSQLLWTLHSLGGLEPDVLQEALSDKNEHIVIQAIRLCESRFPLQEQLQQKLFSLANHDHLRVRFELALILGECADPKAGQILAQILLRDPDHEWIRAAVLSSAPRHVEQILPVVLSEQTTTKSREKLIPPLLATLLGNNDSGIHRALELIASQDAGMSHPSWQFSALGALLDGLQQRGTSLIKLKVEQGDKWNQLLSRVDPWFVRARSVARDPDAPLEQREQCLHLLGRGLSSQSEDITLLSDFASPLQPLTLQFAAVNALAHFTEDRIPGLLLANWRNQLPETQARILDVLLSRETFTAQLLNILEGSKISPRDLDAASRQRLLKHRNPALADRAAKILAQNPTQDRQKVLDGYDTVRTLTGNAIKGETVFKRTCAACHQYRGIGNALGANLATLQDRTTGALLTAILDPNRAVEGKFKTYVAAMKDGRVLNGMIVDLAPNSIMLASSDGKTQTLLRNDIEEFVSNGLSFMPEGLEKDLTPQDVADVIAFLQAK
ncbi:MAG: neutral/alkaline non-lysosomal ceramidase N-terminal domain-containing protein [Planctomycetales bacterium]